MDKSKDEEKNRFHHGNIFYNSYVTGMARNCKLKEGKVVGILS
jgi:hypothetical protein